MKRIAITFLILTMLIGATPDAVADDVRTKIDNTPKDLPGSKLDPELAELYRRQLELKKMIDPDSVRTIDPSQVEMPRAYTPEELKARSRPVVDEDLARLVDPDGNYVKQPSNQDLGNTVKGVQTKGIAGQAKTGFAQGSAAPPETPGSTWTRIDNANNPLGPKPATPAGPAPPGSAAPPETPGSTWTRIDNANNPLGPKPATPAGPAPPGSAAPPETPGSTWTRTDNANNPLGPKPATPAGPAPPGSAAPPETPGSTWTRIDNANNPLGPKPATPAGPAPPGSAAPPETPGSTWTRIDNANNPLGPKPATPAGPAPPGSAAPPETPGSTWTRIDNANNPLGPKPATPAGPATPGSAAPPETPGSTWTRTDNANNPLGPKPATPAGPAPPGSAAPPETPGSTWTRIDNANNPVVGGQPGSRAKGAGWSGNAAPPENPGSTWTPINNANNPAVAGQAGGGAGGARPNGLTAPPENPGSKWTRIDNANRPAGRNVAGAAAMGAMMGAVAADSSVRRLGDKLDSGEASDMDSGYVNWETAEHVGASMLDSTGVPQLRAAAHDVAVQQQIKEINGEQGANSTWERAKAFGDQLVVQPTEEIFVRNWNEAQAKAAAEGREIEFGDFIVEYWDSVAETVGRFTPVGPAANAWHDVGTYDERADWVGQQAEMSQHVARRTTRDRNELERLQGEIDAMIWNGDVSDPDVARQIDEKLDAYRDHLDSLDRTSTFAEDNLTGIDDEGVRTARAERDRFSDADTLRDYADEIMRQRGGQGMNAGGDGELSVTPSGFDDFDEADFDGLEEVDLDDAFADAGMEPSYDDSGYSDIDENEIEDMLIGIGALPEPDYLDAEPVSLSGDSIRAEDLSEVADAQLSRAAEMDEVARARIAKRSAQEEEAWGWTHDGLREAEIVQEIDAANRLDAERASGRDIIVAEQNKNDWMVRASDSFQTDSSWLGEEGAKLDRQRDGIIARGVMGTFGEAGCGGGGCGEGLPTEDTYGGSPSRSGGIGGTTSGWGAGSPTGSSSAEWVVWYTGNVDCWGSPTLYVGSRESVNQPGLKCHEDGGGRDCSISLEKKVMAGGFSSKSDAMNHICGQASSKRMTRWCGTIVKFGGQDFVPGSNLTCDWDSLSTQQ